MIRLERDAVQPSRVHERKRGRSPARAERKEKVGLVAQGGAIGALEWAGVDRRLGRRPIVAVVESADLRSRDDTPGRWRLDGT